MPGSMSSADRNRVVALLALLAAGQTDSGVLNRVASRATGAVVGMVDIDAVLEEVDIDALLARVDINALLERVDIDRLLERVDVNELLDEIDLDRLMAKIDVKDLAERAGIPDIVRESTGALAGSAIDVFRRQVVALDTVIGATAFRLTGRNPASRPASPPTLEVSAEIGADGRGQVDGHYAGPLSRLGAFVIDIAVIWIVWLLTTAGIAFIANLFFSVESTDSATLGLVGLTVLALWAFLYMSISLAIAGRTIGMGIVGVRVVDRQGAPLHGRQALVRTLIFPFSFLFFGLGFLGVFISPERRSLHDAAAGSVVVYDWGDRPAEMPAPLTQWVTRKVDEEASGSQGSSG